MARLRGFMNNRRGFSSALLDYWTYEDVVVHLEPAAVLPRFHKPE